MVEEKKLPKDIIEALSDNKNFKKVCKIAEKTGIVGEGEGIEKLDTIFEKVLSGNLSPSKVVDEVKKEFGFSDELSQDIAKEMDWQIFSNYKESLEKLYGKIEAQVPIKEDITKIEEKEISLPSSPPEPPLPKTPLPTPPSPEPSTEEETAEEKPPEKEDINNILEKLEKELEEEKKEREALDKMFNNKGISSKKNEKNNKRQEHSSDIYREKIDDNEEEKPKIIKEENGRIRKVL